MNSLEDLEKKEKDFMQEQNNLDRLTQSVTLCTVCLEENIPVLAENTKCGHRLCKKCALEIEWGDKIHAVHPTDPICLFVSGVCPVCRRAGKYINVTTGGDLCADKVSPIGWVDEYYKEGEVYKLNWREHVTEQTT